MVRTDDPHPFIHRLQAVGMDDAVIYNRLLLEGWSHEDVAPIFEARGAEIRSSALAPNVASTPRSIPRPRRVSLTSVFLVLFTIGALGTSAYFYFKPPIVYSISLPIAPSTLPALTYGALPALSDPDYHASVKRELILKQASFIDANLTLMQLETYERGTLTLSVPIIAKGKVGSWWETPTGIYQIQTKERSHYSSFGHVYQPWSLEFQGNFFIHGIPTYEDGTPVSSSYSGGCIRLATDDAKKVYEIVSTGIPVIVYNAKEKDDTFSYQLKAPVISATEYLVADINNGTVLMSRHSSEAAPIASITKLITALIATEYINLDKDITVPSTAIVYTSVPRLKAGTSVRAYDLLFLLLQESSNEAAETIASAIGRAQFVDHMNEKARAINLTRTLFTDPSGAKEDISTSEDLFTLLKYINENRRFVFDITRGTLADNAYGTTIYSTINNFNKIPGVAGELLGGKIGQTLDAGETYAGIFSVKIGTETREIAVIVLGSRDAQTDVKRLLQSVHASYAPSDSRALLAE